MTLTVTDRILGCLTGIATGDAIGKQTEMLSHEDVLHWYPQAIRGFEATPGWDIPRSLGNANYDWRRRVKPDHPAMNMSVAGPPAPTWALSPDTCWAHLHLSR